MISILLGIILLYLGAEALVRGSTSLALRFGISPLIAGLTIVAFGTSAPELTVSMSAAFDGLGDVAVGNVVGSNIFNIAVILGLTAIIRPPSVHLKLIRREIPIMILISLVAFALVASGEVSRFFGIILTAGLIFYTLSTIRLARREQDAIDLPEIGPLSKVPIVVSLVMVGVGLALLVWGSRWFVDGAIFLARSIGVSEAVIGLTIVSAGTSLPELATSVVAALRRHSDVAIGNVVGSCIFNVLCILGITATIQPLSAQGIALRDVVFMLGTAVILLPFAHTQRSISRFEGLALLGIYGIYLYLLWPRS